MTSQRSSVSRSQQAGQIKQRRTEQLEYVSGRIAPLQASLREAEEQEKKRHLLESVSRGLYDEVDKLAKKVPADEVTKLVLTQVNDLIKETKELITDDPYVQRLEEFVPAGENPEHRDAVVVLRLVREGLERFRQDRTDRITHLRMLLSDAKGLQVALRLSLEEDLHLIDEETLARHGVAVSRPWIDGHFNGKVDFARLDNVSLSEYFEH